MQFCLLHSMLPMNVCLRMVSESFYKLVQFYSCIIKSLCVVIWFVLSWDKPDLIIERFEKLALDVVGPLDRSKQGHAYLLTAMDPATHFTYALPMKGYTAEETARNLIKIIWDMGPPSQILTDQRQNFMSKVLKQVTDKFAITRIRISPYQPESNGSHERSIEGDAGELFLFLSLQNFYTTVLTWCDVK